MKKLLSLLLVSLMVCSMVSIASAETTATVFDPELVAAAQAEGELTVYASCEEAYMNAAADNFQKLFGITVNRQRLSTGEVAAKIEEENGNPSADVWFGGTTDPYNESAAKGLLEAYDAKNASHLTSDLYRDKDGYWYGIYKGILGFMVNTEEITRLGLQVPMDWDDLIKPEYKGLIWMSNPNTAGTAKLIINTMVQMKGHDAAMEYFKALDANVAQYTKSGSGPSKMVGPGECVIGIGFLHDGITQILAGYDNIQLVLPASGTSYEVGATAIFKGAKHMNAAKLWIEYALSPECVNLAKTAESYQFLVLDNAEQPAEATQFGLDANKTINYDFADAKANTSKYVEDFFAAIGSGADDRFKTE
ncbi:MAG TPA: ABC transporter substrate-binding protein [Candidatus Limiplasma sp.]|nr:ABC transporter substrate-binding protein [Candidatus Limiplasma sp.]